VVLKILSPALTLKSAAVALRTYLCADKPNAAEDFCVKIELDNFDLAGVFANVKGLARSYFKSRDSETEICGLGIAAKINFVDLKYKTSSLVDEQCYVGASRFDQQGSVAKEWAGFGQHYYILPLILLIKRATHCSLLLNFRKDGHLSLEHFLDQAISLLSALENSAGIEEQAQTLSYSEEMPKRTEYFSMIEKALGQISSSPLCQKVVLGRRNTLHFGDREDAYTLFARVAKKTESAFLFWLDDGRGSSFFGASPELLYQRKHAYFATESLAGTRARGQDRLQDEYLRNDLCQSSKDRSEHALVSQHIESSLRVLNASLLRQSGLLVMALSYVQHLVKRYEASIDPMLSDEAILQALHPTPAVSGLSRDWALDFIRQHEGFDRGFYAGPIGYAQRHKAEFAVAIRSALMHEKSLHIYAANGIVPGSRPEQEWEELNNKQSRILSIFEGGLDFFNIRNK
jgi:menaquinone-specific isochorismate synthase